MRQFQIAASIAENEIRAAGFEIISRDDRFIERPPITERAGSSPHVINFFFKTLLWAYLQKGGYLSLINDPPILNCVGKLTDELQSKAIATHKELRDSTVHEFRDMTRLYLKSRLQVAT
jgi:hypothetical protein